MDCIGDSVGRLGFCKVYVERHPSLGDVGQVGGQDQSPDARHSKQVQGLVGGRYPLDAPSQSARRQEWLPLGPSPVFCLFGTGDFPDPQAPVVTSQRWSERQETCQIDIEWARGTHLGTALVSTCGTSLTGEDRPPH